MADLVVVVDWICEAHIPIAGVALLTVRVGALSTALCLSNCDVAELTTFTAVVTTAFFFIFLLVVLFSTLRHINNKTKEHLGKEKVNRKLPHSA